MIDRVGVSQQIQLIQPGTDRAFDAPKRIPGQQLLQPLKPDHGFLGHVREALPQRRGLSCHVVGTSHHHQIDMFRSQRGQAGQQGNQPVPHEDEGLTDLQLFNVLSEIPRGHSAMNVLLACQYTELIDSSLDIVASDFLARRNRPEIDIVQYRFIGFDRPFADLNSQ